MATDKITMHESAYAGSIGVVSVHRPPNKNEVTFISSQSQYKRVDPTTDAGGKYIQTQIDKYGDLFIGAVSIMRAVPVEKVLSDFGEGGVMLGAEAVKVGMADALGTFEGTLAALQADHRKKTTGFIQSDLATSATEREKDMAINTELAGKIVAGLDDNDKKALLAALGVAEQPATATQPTQPAAAQPAQMQTASATTNSSDPAIVAMLNRALTAECNAFISEMKTAGRITPAEEASAKQVYMSVAALPDQTALNNYKVSIQARPASPMLSEKVASTGKVLVLQNGQQGSEGPTAETEAAEIAKLCRTTPEGMQAMTALKAGKTTPAWEQFAVSPLN
jgi:hypothetical protein